MRIILILLAINIGTAINSQNFRKEVIKKAGSWLQFENTKLGQGMEASKNFLKENPEVSEKIKQILLGGVGK